jgi:hypothetical protein
MQLIFEPITTWHEQIEKLNQTLKIKPKLEFKTHGYIECKWELEWEWGPNEV